MRPKKNYVSNNPVLIHLLCWVVFIAYEVTLVTIVRASQGAVDSIWKDYAVPYLLNIALFYFHALYVLRICFAAKRKKIVLFVCLVFAELAVYLVLMRLKEFIFLNIEQDLSYALYPSKVSFARQLWRGIYFLIFSTAFWLIQNSFKKERRLKEAETKALHEEKEKQDLELQLAISQNAFLQAQINPHLLFNTLNFIHSEVQQSSPKASDAIITLSDMMRYSLTEIKNDGKVSLQKEVEQIENLIQINQYRFSHKLSIAFTLEGDFENERIIPLLLVPFVENLFKYGDLTDMEDPAVISIVLEEHVLKFITRNKKRKCSALPSTGIGIKNVTTRLNLSYPGRYSLSIKNQEFHSVNLTIKLNDDNLLYN